MDAQTALRRSVDDPRGQGREEYRQAVRDAVDCPVCPAERGDMCSRKNGNERLANHQRRIDKFVRMT
jgi:hypothetical protein